MTTLCPPPSFLPPTLPSFPYQHIRLMVPAESHLVPLDLGQVLSTCNIYPILRRHYEKGKPLTFPLKPSVLEEITQLESDLYAWSGDESLWAWLEGVHAEHNTALRLKLRDASPKMLRIVLWSQDVRRQAQPMAC